MSRFAIALVSLGVVGVIRADPPGEYRTDPPRSRLAVTYAAPRHAGVVGAPVDHVAWMRGVIADLDRELRLPHSITVKYEDCDAANAYYYATSHSIVICHQLWDQRRKAYVAAGSPSSKPRLWWGAQQRESSIDATLGDAMAYTVFHEFAHALHHELQLPIVGRIEDAVDEIATMWLIRIGERGREIAKHAAYGHLLRSKLDHDFGDEHASGAQRGFAIACLVHGVEPARVADLMAGVPAPRLAKCARDYPQRLATWRTLFEPHLQQPSDARVGLPAP